MDSEYLTLHVHRGENRLTTESQYSKWRLGKFLLETGQTVLKLPPGYTLGLVLESVIQYQAGTQHRDPVHVTAHFMRPPTPGHFEVHVNVLKTGRSFRNLTARLVQDVRALFLLHNSA